MPSPGSALDSRLEHLRENRTSGALDLALEAITLAQDWIDTGADLAALAAQLQETHPGIATVRNVGRLLHDDPGITRSRLKEMERSLRSGNQRIAAALKQFIAPGATIITLSNSSTVTEALSTLNPARVFVMEIAPRR